MRWGGAELTRAWTDFYTRGLPDDVAARRRAEIASDLHEQMSSDASAAGRGIASRTVRGLHADLAWRREERRAVSAVHAQGSRLRRTWSVCTQGWFAPLALLIVAFELLGALAVVRDDKSTMPGRVVGPVLLVVLAIVLVAGLWLRWRVGVARTARAETMPRVRTAPVRRLGWIVVVLAVTLVLLVVGVSTGMVSIFFTALVLVGGTALVLGGNAIARALRSSDLADRAVLADGMIVVGVIPALAFFWMIVPAVLAIAVIAGTFLTEPRVRPAG